MIGCLIVISIVFSFVVFPFLMYIAPETMGIVAGMITAVGIAFKKIMEWVYKSNHLGDSTGQYEDYTDEPMKFEG